ncbi:bifunctional precorrin-2 dehydrogenase/sirohydrochlorin ferrochelatase [Candidatus Bathyarchaeota archaeon]|nr:bifunctional precorrin-2 dehydrogenase/sirohydrochlorin ferrochelatase [Candidatus Bathyarchaeota archaeon]MBT4319617.1 bifunctional precorrin-2 dehydrogenase/sirohydrochlorin ferrochelatase [Candidatus Bathyarchaeota archaeon]MBT4424953.1 bifunctional precorrin-2 dehydrogenase/sirohydrochlorin ferrochelatase [Candidatus Bathyarchaeota archaeon]MBT5642667.1 bifunctional precorrin-2 dehydrogenase/sirohydrochlorin ferrochelatase [Candidatus Bathyarchaeota archaeon]MBT6604632.1 bifunctional pre
MLIDLRMDGSKTLVIGGGKLGERKAKSLIKHQADVTIISETFTPTLVDLGKQGKVILVEQKLENATTSLRTHIKNSKLVFAATNDRTLNQLVSKLARESRVLVCAVDMPEICDFYSPAVFHRGSIRVGICTDGKSPIVSKVLKKRLSSQVTEMDSLNLEVQHHARELAKKKINNSSDRRDTLYKIFNDPGIHMKLESGKIGEAKTAAEAIIEKASQVQSSDD